jgi:glycosyltransferase involved in cell wall biosynthesis
MYRDRSVAVVVPAYNEELLIGRTVEGMPDFVDHIVVVDDASKDGTSEKVKELSEKDERVVLITLPENLGVGGAIRTGYAWCRDRSIDIAVVMAGDGQMDPADLPALLDPVVSGRADYTKGNRLITGEAWNTIPRVRYLGNAALSFLTKIASGYWHIADSQTGYTAINLRALKLIPVENIYPRYGMPNDLLVTLNIYGLRVMDVPVKPVYGIGEKSGIRIPLAVFTIGWLIIRLFFRRLMSKYVIRDFHPLVFFYLMGFGMLLIDLPLMGRFAVRWYEMGTVPPITALALCFFTITGLQSLLFAMLFDMEANRSLRGDPEP